MNRYLCLAFLLVPACSDSDVTSTNDAGNGADVGLNTDAHQTKPDSADVDASVVAAQLPRFTGLGDCVDPDDTSGAIWVEPTSGGDYTLAADRILVGEVESVGVVPTFGNAQSCAPDNIRWVVKVTLKTVENLKGAGDRVHFYLRGFVLDMWATEPLELMDGEWVPQLSYAPSPTLRVSDHFGWSSGDGLFPGQVVLAFLRGDDEALTPDHFPMAAQQDDGTFRFQEDRSFSCFDVPVGMRNANLETIKAELEKPPIADPVWLTPIDPMPATQSHCVTN